jgi:hypothetical protein
MENENVKGWGAYIGGNFLKAENVKDENQVFICTKIEDVESDGRSRIRLTLESDGVEWDFDLNVTNAKKLKEVYDHPLKAIGCQIFFKKVLVTNPQTKKEVESLRIHNIK